MVLVSHDFAIPYSSFQRLSNESEALWQRSKLHCNHNKLSRESTLLGTAKSQTRTPTKKPTAMLKRKAGLHWQLLTTDFKRRLALRNYTARNHRLRAQDVVCFRAQEPKEQGTRAS